MSETAKENLPPKSGPTTVTIALMVLGAGAIGGGVSGAGMLMIRPAVASASVEGVEGSDAHAPADAGHGADAAAGEGHDGEGHGAPPATGVGILALEPFIVNLADTDHERYLKATMKIGIRGDALLSRAKEDDVSLARVRDAVVMTLSASTAEELRTTEGKEAVRSRVRMAVVAALAVTEKEVPEVYFTDCFTQ